MMISQEQYVNLRNCPLQINYLVCIKALEKYVKVK